MCSSPKVKQPKEKPPVYLSNPWLDGMRINAQAQGRNALVNQPLEVTPSVPRIQDPTAPGLRVPGVPASGAPASMQINPPPANPKYSRL